MIVENLFCFLLLEKKRDGSDCYGRIGGEGEIEKNKIMKEEEKEKDVKIIMIFFNSFRGRKSYFLRRFVTVFVSLMLIAVR